MSQDDVDQMKAMIREKIAKHGWMVTGVFPRQGEDGVPFAYTIGLTDAGLPELIMSGPFDPETLQNFLNMAGDRHVTQEGEIKPGDMLDYLANVPFKVIAATTGEHVQQALNFYGDPENWLGVVKLLQILWPDRDGNFPGDPGWTSDAAQELYG